MTKLSTLENPSLEQLWREGKLTEKEFAALKLAELADKRVEGYDLSFLKGSVTQYRGRLH